MSTMITGKKPVPFLRGMLAHYLIEHGFTFQEAYQVADQVRKTLQKEKEISPKKMAGLVQEQSQKLFEDRPIGDGIFWEPVSRQVLVEDGQGRHLFSLERLEDSLMVPGLNRGQAHRIAGQIESDFIRKDKRIVARGDVFKAALKILKKEGGEEYADRYRVWHRFRNEEYPLPMILFLGGASGVGKSSVSVALANQLKISRLVSTDSIRQIMRLMIAPDLIPALHESSYAAWEKVSAPSESADPVVPAYREQAGRVCVGVRAMIERAIEERTSLIVDGVHLLPELLDLGAYADQALFFWVNLHLSDEDLYRQRFKSRSEQAEGRSSHRYLEYLESILKIQQHLLAVGDMYNVPAVENIDFDETVQLISLQIMDFLRDKVNRKVLVPK